MLDRHFNTHDIILKGSAEEEVVIKDKGSTVTLHCLLNGTFTSPAWEGPPDYTIYFTENSGTVSNHRYSRTGNGTDLVINNIQALDEGYYQCSFTGLGVYRLVVAVPDNITYCK